MNHVLTGGAQHRFSALNHKHAILCGLIVAAAVLACVRVARVSKWRWRSAARLTEQQQGSEGTRPGAQKASARLHTEQEAGAAEASQAGPLDQDLTIIFTTSPVQSNPSTELVEANVKSFDFARDITTCRKIFVCDGWVVKDHSVTAVRKAMKSFRSGVIERSHIALYQEFKRRLQRLIDDAGPGDNFQNSMLLELEERQGFGFAVKAALEHVQTNYVMVIQHDRLFVREVQVEPLVRVLKSDDAVNMISLLTRSTMAHAKRIRSRCLRIAGSCNVPKEDWVKAAMPRIVHGQRLVPMLQWLDSTHVAKTEYYRNFVFNGYRVSKGGFIEDKLGSIMLDALRERGFAAHSKFATWILDDLGPEPMVAHWCGRGFITEEERSRLAGKCTDRSALDLDSESSE